MLRMFRGSAGLIQNPLRKGPTTLIGACRCDSSYDHDGKTKISIMNNDFKSVLMINAYSESGFRLNNEVKVIGPMAIFPRSVLSWDVSEPDNINEESLSLFFLLQPKIDILVLGIGDEQLTRENAFRILTLTRNRKLNVEILPTYQACATFNFLSADGRMVAGGLIPPRIVPANDSDMVKNATRRIQGKLNDSDHFKLSD